MTQNTNDRAYNYGVVSIMVELARSSVFNRLPIIPSDCKIEWNELMDVSIEQGILPWVWDGICKLKTNQQPPRQERINWSLSCQEWCDSYYQQKDVLNHIISVCKNYGIRIMLLKGIGLSKLYPNPELRVCGDIDIFLFGDYEKGNELFSGGEYIYGEHDKHANFTYHGVIVENHQTLINTNTKRQRLVEHYIESTLENAVFFSEGYYVLPPLTNLVFLVMHALSHMESHIALTFRNLMDIAFLLDKNRSNIEASECLKTMHHIKIAKSFELVLSMAERVSGLSFKNYHENKIPIQDVDKALEMIVGKDTSSEIPLNIPLFTQISLRRSYYRKHQWKYKYIPFSRISSLMRIYRPPISNAIKHFLNYGAVAESTFTD